MKRWTNPVGDARKIAADSSSDEQKTAAVIVLLRDARATIAALRSIEADGGDAGQQATYAIQVLSNETR